MEFLEWKPVYETICADFGYSIDGDRQVRDRLADLFGDAIPFDPSRLGIDGTTVAVAGAGPNLADDCELAAEADIVFAASTAADRLREIGIEIDCMVTDLDKNPETVVELIDSGTPVAIHAHGDNRTEIERVVPDLDLAWVIPTTQAEPVGPVRNDGGFTDGDRGAFLADALGADELRFPGWHFEDPSVGPEKAHKLVWAERLLHWLERRRNESFAILDGRRDDIDTNWMP